jgi:hypothetical protein
VLLLLLIAALADTVRVPPVTSAPRFDGVVSVEEYGAPSMEIARPGGTIRLWLRRDSSFVYLAASMPDSSFYWGDDLVISLDIRGDRDAGPGHFDFQWYFRRVLDSSVVYRGDGGYWRAPQDNPDWRLGTARDGGGWEVRSANEAAGWSIEARFDPEYFAPSPGRLTGFAVRVYDNDPSAWYVWPDRRDLKQPTELERRPDRWGMVVLTSRS